MRNERLLVIDGLNTFIRNWAVVPSMNANGEPIGGVVGFIRSMKASMRDVKPSLVVVVWDGEGGSAKRRGIYADYKAGRKPRVNRQYEFENLEQSQQNLKTQYAKVKQLLELLGVVQLELDNIEADDVIAFICKHVKEKTQKVVLSSDKDFLQLVDPWTIVYSPSKKKYYTISEMKAEYNVLPGNFIFVKAMMGDGSDNIPGVGGIAEKTAVKLFPFLSERQTNLTEIFQHAEANKDKSPRYRSLLDKRDLLIGNVELMQLTSPIISPQSGRVIRMALESPEKKLVLSEFKLAMVRDGIQLTDADLFQVFREYAGHAVV